MGVVCKNPGPAGTNPNHNLALQTSPAQPPSTFDAMPWAMGRGCLLCGGGAGGRVGSERGGEGRRFWPCIYIGTCTHAACDLFLTTYIHDCSCY